MSALDDDVSRMWRIRRTLWQMLRQRGYLVPDEKLKGSLEDFRAEFLVNGRTTPNREDLIMLVQRVDDPTDQLFVFFPDEGDGKKVGVKPIREYWTRMSKQKATRAVLVVREGMTSFAKQALDEAAFVMEVFVENELLVNITEHVLVPQHIVLNDVEKKKLLDRYGLKETQLPRIRPYDPVVRFLGLHKGQVIKIIRPSETAGRYVTYRLVN
eukprot:TRINITY_DN28615_c0_g1_i1.p1 TRINITY_DN28615_c0_g1~~TRINITY_DN28615_c0_g1_i1.p1  ORF type:complete len:212 (+),score=29.15 TRINITY_DN28615_c0_g1_i1:369-1004(+)